MIRQNKTSHLPTASAEYKPGFSLVIIFWDGVAVGIWFDVFLYVDSSLAKSTVLQVQLRQICWNRIHLVDNGKGAINDLPGQWSQSWACVAPLTSTYTGNLHKSNLFLILKKCLHLKLGQLLVCDVQTKPINCWLIAFWIFLFSYSSVSSQSGLSNLLFWNKSFEQWPTTVYKLATSSSVFCR